jgi:hypothetical protein
MRNQIDHLPSLDVCRRDMSDRLSLPCNSENKSVSPESIASEQFFAVTNRIEIIDCTSFIETSMAA